MQYGKTNSETNDRLLKRPEVLKRVPLSSSTLYEMMAAGQFPRPIKIGKQSVAWRESDIEQWIQTRVDLRNAKPSWRTEVSAMSTAAHRGVRDVFDELFQADQERPAIRKAGIEALQRLVPVAQRDTGQSGVIGRFLLGLYNGQAFPFDLTELRRLDLGLFDDCLAVLRLDNTPEQEVHEYLPHGDAIWADFRERWA